MRKVSLGFGKGNGVIPYPIGSIIAARLFGFEFVPTRDGRDNKKLTQALQEANDASSDDDAKAILAGLDQNLFYERCILECSDGTQLRTINEGYSEVPQALIVVARNYETTDPQGNKVVREGKALRLATAEQIKSGSTVGDHKWAMEKFAEQPV